MDEQRLSTPARLEGTLFVSATRALYLYVGPLVATTRHAHHAAQIVIAPQGLELEDGARGRIHAGTAVIPPRLPHRHGACAHAAVLFLDGDDLASRELARRAEPRCETWRRDILDVSVPRDPSRQEARALIASILSAVELRQPAEPRHPAARRMCTYLDGSEPVDLARLAREAGLSPRQMRHTFARDVGLPMRAYLRWRRLRRAIHVVHQALEQQYVAKPPVGFALDRRGAHAALLIRHAGALLGARARAGERATRVRADRPEASR